MNLTGLLMHVKIKHYYTVYDLIKKAILHNIA